MKLTEILRVEPFVKHSVITVGPADQAQPAHHAALV